MTEQLHAAAALKPQQRPRHIVWICGLVAWVLARVIGFGALWEYEDTPGKTPTDAVTWPREARLPLARRTPTLVMVAHPLCSCTRASLAELSKLMTAVDRRLATYVIVAGSNAATVPEQTAIFRQAAAIPGVLAVADADGSYRRPFGAATSGHVFLYDETGRLRFSGGITPARGHQGPSNGGATIVSFVNRRSLTRPSTSVFGCLIETPRRTK